ncbi:molybdenum cofactor cytidylyltransferase [Microbulbifer donghaiensis]|uniref:Molybdenum cofactor cytidylyltransferase n=1 Tax=Microbulbifer donghaiensis TaxID=494016 RepID=A0A1M5H6Z3_9GAMM|nr:molybdenum cofactor cytidylyltransferase [Microbulbifer donghaiensis]
MQYSAILLAAGFSRRFGSDKRLANVNGDPMLLASVRNLQSAIAGMSSVDLQIVVRAQDSIVTSMLANIVKKHPDSLLQAPAWPVGLGVSIAAGVNALLARGCRPDAVAICLADMPFVKPDTLRRLMYGVRPNSICVPLYEGRRGHPIVFGKKFFPELTKLRGRRGTEKILRAHSDSIRELVVDDPGVILDFDRPEDFFLTAQPDLIGRIYAARGTKGDVPVAAQRG